MFDGVDLSQMRLYCVKNHALVLVARDQSIIQPAELLISNQLMDAFIRGLASHLPISTRWKWTNTSNIMLS